jgi:hypothetical protein
MTRINYATTRNKAPKHMTSMSKSHIINCELTKKEINRLIKNSALYNDFETSFFNNLRSNNFKVRTDKQMVIVRKLLSKQPQVKPTEDKKEPVERIKLTEEQIEIIKAGIREGGIKFSKIELSISVSIEKYHYVCTKKQMYHIEKMIKKVLDFYESF